MTQRVFMDLTEQNRKDAEYLKKALQASNKAEVVQIALNTLTGLSKLIHKGDEVIIRHKDGSIRQIDIPRINCD